MPAQVVVKHGRETAKVQLSQRFQEAVDRAAMRAGRGSSDAYLADWKRSEPRELRRRPPGRGDAEGARLEARYSDADLERLIRAKGIDAPSADEPPAPAGTAGEALMHAVRLWSVRHARGLAPATACSSARSVALHPLWRRIGYERLERPWRPSSGR